MSALAAVFIGDTIVFATDTICSDRSSKINKKGNELNETIVAFSSKSVYLPHLQTSVSILGTTMLSREYHRFIDEDYSTRAISSFDELLSVTEKNFIKFIDRPEIKRFQKLDELAGSNFLGMIFLIGLSNHNNKGEEITSSTMKALKIMVYKDHITKTLMNHDYDQFMYCTHPPLPESILDNIFTKNAATSIDSLITDLITAAKNIYDSSLRKEPLTGGELNFTTMVYADGRLNTSHYTGHRFEDFKEIVQEIKEHSAARKMEDSNNRVREIVAKSSMLLDIMNKNR